MTDRWAGHDPERGCGLMLLAASIAALAVIVVVTFLLIGAH